VNSEQYEASSGSELKQHDKPNKPYELNKSKELNKPD